MILLRAIWLIACGRDLEATGEFLVGTSVVMPGCEQDDKTGQALAVSRALLSWRPAKVWREHKSGVAL